LQTQDGSVCTTGNPTLDQQKLNINNYQILNSKYGYSVKSPWFFESNGQTAAPNPLPPARNTDGFLNGSTFEWESYTGQNLGRLFMAMNDVSEGDRTGTDFGQKQGTITFGEGADRSCVRINWDPHGTVFDADTLQPISNARIVVFKKDALGNFQKLSSNDTLGLPTSATTDVNGHYAFMLPDGVYKLEVSAPGYALVTDTQRINYRYSQQYYDIYTGGEILQKNQQLHLDVSLQQTNKPFMDAVVSSVKQLLKL